VERESVFGIFDFPEENIFLKKSTIAECGGVNSYRQFGHIIIPQLLERGHEV